MNMKQISVAAVVAISLGALGSARELRAAIEHRDSGYRAAPSGSPNDVLTRLRANAKFRAVVRGDK
jgi:hypothetical protein